MLWILGIFAGALGLAVILVGAILAIYWQPDRPVDELKERWAPAPSQFVDVAGLSIHLRDVGPRGDPAPLMLLHGTSASLHTWEGWTQRLEGERRVICFDMPGFGLTSPSPDDDYRIDNYVRVVIAVMDRLAVRECVIAGNSLGGYVALATALLHPERVSKLILVDSAGYPFQSDSVPLAFRIAQLPVVGRIAFYILPRRVIRDSVRSVYGDPSKVTTELIDRYYDVTTRAGNRRALVGRFRQTQSDSLALRIPELKMPTLILWGGRDRLIPPASGHRFNKEIEDSELIEFPELGHVPQEEDPAATVTAVIKFLGQR